MAFSVNYITTLLRGEKARFPPTYPGFDSRARRYMWVEFVVGSLPCSERVFSGYSGFPLSSKANIFKFQFDVDCQHFCHEPLARKIAQALPVFDIKFAFTFTLQKELLFEKLSVRRTLMLEVVSSLGIRSENPHNTIKK